MVSPKIISSEFLLWAQSLLLWSIAAYGVTADPLQEESASSLHIRWMLLVSFRAILAAALAYALSCSIVLSGLLLLTTLLQPLVRYRLPMSLLAEFEGFWMAAFMVCDLAIIRYRHLPTRWITAAMPPAQLAALCILTSTLLVVVRGGTYIVRGVLSKSGTSPSRKQLEGVLEPAPTSQGQGSTTSMAASVEPFSLPTVDVEEYNRGRLIGSLERIVLTIVVAAGSYAALAFLVAAKGIVRSDEFDKNRDFAEYFLIGSLASVLVALCAGMALRFALIRLWPDLLSLQIQ
jgi:hypothetical protein